MNLKSPPSRAVSLAAVFALGTAGYFAVSAASHAQSPAPKSGPVPDNAALQKKVEVLERQVEALQKQVADLKRQRVTVPLQQGTTLFLPPYRITPLPSAGLSARPGDPSLGTPFEFNGRTYYRTPLKNNGHTPAGSATYLVPVK